MVGQAGVVDIDKKTTYVSSAADGTIFRGSTGQEALEPFLPAGADGRASALGMTVHRGRLLVAGGQTGRLFSYDTGSGKLGAAFTTDAAGENPLVNDIAVSRGVAYATDSYRPALFRLTARQLETDDGSTRAIRPWLDLRDTPIRYEKSFNLNGIVARGPYLLAVQSNTGKLWRIDTRTKKTTQVRVSGGKLTNGDGLVLRGSTLYVVRNLDNLIATVKLGKRARTARVTGEITDPSFRIPTTAATVGSRLLVVNSQFDRQTGTPDLPFTVSSIRRP